MHVKVSKSVMSKEGFRVTQSRDDEELLSSYEQELASCHMIIASLMCIIEKVKEHGGFVDYQLTEEEVTNKLKEYHYLAAQV